VSSLPDSARELIVSGALAHLVSINEDGSPHVTCIWVGLDGDELVSGHLGPRRQLENIRRDPRVVVSMESPQTDQMDLKQYLVMHGVARISEGGGPELLQRLARTYLGPDVNFPPMDDPPEGYINHIAVERIGGNGPWNPR
jgi:PPOX class probable F420-dependent enzyme